MLIQVETTASLPISGGIGDAAGGNGSGLAKGFRSLFELFPKILGPGYLPFGVHSGGSVWAGLQDRCEVLLRSLKIISFKVICTKIKQRFTLEIRWSILDDQVAGSQELFVPVQSPIQTT
jgi:hypothetical protein